MQHQNDSMGKNMSHDHIELLRILPEVGSAIIFLMKNDFIAGSKNAPMSHNVKFGE